jgi:hypothetical protein
MNIIHTSAPIAIQDLKKFFIDKSISYIIDYDTSTLKGQKLLTYLGNLDIPCNVTFDPENNTHLELFKSYLETSFLVKVNSLERAAIVCLLEYKGLTDSKIYIDFIQNNLDLIKSWESRLDSLTLYNMWCIDSQEFKDWVITHPEDTSDNSKYANFVNLLKHEDFYDYYQSINTDSLRYYSKLFNDYCFKGENLYAHWAVDENPLFLLTWGIASGNVEHKDVEEAFTADINEYNNNATGDRLDVSPV